LGASVQNFTLLGRHADFLRPLIWSPVSGLMRFLTADQKQQCVNVWEELCQIASYNAAFLSRVITIDPETKQQSSQWKSRNSPKPKKRQDRSSQEHAHHFLLHQGDCLQRLHSGTPNSQFCILL
jgi:hypothetical protein